MEPEGSIPNSHEVSTCPYKDPLKYYPTTYFLAFLVASCGPPTDLYLKGSFKG
jgi:hypothetical protein